MSRLMFLVAMVVLLGGTALLAEATPPGRDAAWDGGGQGKVVFDGAIHSGADNKCNACHPNIFPMKRGGTTITMKDINAGRLCGACHNGKDAFSVADCQGCHQK